MLRFLAPALTDATGLALSLPTWLYTLTSSTCTFLNFNPGTDSGGARAVLVQDPNVGRLLVAYPASPSSFVTLARFDLDGQLDPTMGTGGVVSTGRRLTEGSSVALAVDGQSRSLLAFVAYDGPLARRLRHHFRPCPTHFPRISHAFSSSVLCHMC